MIRKLYNRILREHLPRKRKVLNGVVTRKARLLDLTTVNPDYEAPLIRSIREYVHRNDTCLIIGAGWGVSSVAAARITNKVITYEGSLDQVVKVQKTLSLNDVEGRVDLRRGLVGGRGEIYGESEAMSVPPPQLPEAEVLVMDCEGAEIEILRRMTKEPRTIIVESHGHLGTATKDILERLEELGYSICRVEAENKENDVMVVTAMRRETI